jgi:hypothetical protein
MCRSSPNGRRDPEDAERDPSPMCRLAAVEFLQEVLARGWVVLDLAGEIEAEYRRYPSPRGQPGVGDRFYLEVLNSAPQYLADTSAAGRIGRNREGSAFFRKGGRRPTPRAVASGTTGDLPRRSLRLYVCLASN